jgi:alkylation response protein AidB-like acyl-CoA dehydrogenase
VAVPTSSVESVVDRAAALVPILRENALETERAKRVLPEHFEALSEAGIFRMAAPKRFGGFEADFQTQCDALAHIARGCPSTSWVSTIFSAMGWLAGTFSDEAQEEIFATGDPRISGAFSFSGTSVRKNGDLVVSGRWPFNTGCHGAEWTYLNTLLQNDGEPVPTAVYVRASELTILDDWDASGMAGTGSNTVVAEDVVVPLYRSHPLFDLIEGAYPPSRSSGNPYFRYQTAPVLVVNAGGTPLGIAQGALEAYFERLPGRQITYTSYANQAQAPITHLQVAQASLTIDSADSHVRRAAALMDETPGALSVDARMKARAHIGFGTGLARDAVDTLFLASGASSIQSHVPIQRFQRDIQALSNHAIMLPPTNIELYGRYLCGVEEPLSPLF